MKDTMPYNNFNTFTKHVEDVRMLLTSERPIINLALFRYFTSNDIEIDEVKYAEDIDFALEYGYFDNQFEPSFDKVEGDPLVFLEKPLVSVLEMMNGSLSNGFITQFKDAYDAPFDANSKEFWEKVFGIKIEF
jgi:hypothetical protein